jgi:small subunit ribosomal protein S15
MLTIKEKQKIIDKFKTHEKDTGSPDVQIAVLTEQIKQLASHLKKNPKDNHSRRGLLKMVAQRKSLLDYLYKKNPERYKKTAKKAGLKLRQK